MLEDKLLRRGVNYEKGRGGGAAKSNMQPFSDYRHGAALDVHQGLNRKMDFFKKQLNT